ncbi:hypothetical protein [Actinoplanes sp. NPDC089786]|uniref:hypothetical protein n=1 Tax=Actinoplanes sp. NPDC089786 TaxID=3155185 RepID=UPI003439B36F
MISLVLAMLWSRRGQALGLGLLSLFAVASAVIAPGYVAATDQAVAAGQMANATAGERTLAVRTVSDPRRVDQGLPDPQTTVRELGSLLGSLDGFRFVYAAEIPAVGVEPDNADRTRLVYRQDLCDHVVTTAGRCLIDEGEALLGEEAARRLGITAGDRIELSFAAFDSDPRHPGYVSNGTPKSLTVAGVYRVADRADPYWGDRGYFAFDTGNRPGEPVFTNRVTFESTDRGATDITVDATATASALSVGHLGALRSDLAEFQQLVQDLQVPVTVESGIPDLLSRIDAGRREARTIVPPILVPLVLLACVSIFVAARHGAQDRSPELAAVSLRGVRWWQRLWLAAGESTLAVLAGSIAGCLAGRLLVGLAAAAVLPGSRADAGLTTLRWAPVAVAAALAAVLLAQRRLLLAPVTLLLRRVPSGGRGARGLFADVLVLGLTVPVLVQFAGSGGEFTGLGALTVAAAVAVGAVIAARTMIAVVGGYARRALRRGRVDLALAGLQIARRPGAVPLFALVVAAVSVAGYGTVVVDVAARGRDARSEALAGADRVLDVQPVSRAGLLTAVRAIDPDGAWAMAVARLPGGVLAADTTRLATVPFWPAGGPDAAATARALRPSAPSSLVLRGSAVAIDLSVEGFSADRPVRLTAVFAAVDGRDAAEVEFGMLAAGRNRFRATVEACRSTCRLVGLRLTTLQGTTGIAGAMVITRIAGGLAEVPSDQLADPARWRMSAYGRLSAGRPGLRIEVSAPAGLPDGAWLRWNDGPSPPPAAYAGDPAPPPSPGTGGDRPVEVRRVLRLPAVPAAGGQALLADLEFADRASTDVGPAFGPQVWLSARAPADVVARLAAQGVAVTGDVRVAEVHRRLDRQGTALALWIYLLAAALAVALATGSLVQAALSDRAGRAGDLTALRTQGVGRAVTARATAWTYPALAVAAGVTGMAVALLLWWATGWALLGASTDELGGPQPYWPRPWVFAGAGVTVLTVLTGAAVSIGRPRTRFPAR